uniref:Uncharacterized protein n=1 Tax=Romanomermis culicivorax TaxID=13658 RepID=A0A915KUM2_ROMCU
MSSSHVNVAKRNVGVSRTVTKNVWLRQRKRTCDVGKVPDDVNVLTVYLLCYFSHVTSHKGHGVIAEMTIPTLRDKKKMTDANLSLTSSMKAVAQQLARGRKRAGRCPATSWRFVAKKQTLSDSKATII